MVAYVVAIEPENDLINKIKEIKKKSKELVGNQLYLNDEPHITVYMGNFEDISVFDERFGKLAADIKGHSLSVNINRWIVFKNDAVTKKHTLACGINKDDVQQLRKLQENIVSFMCPKRKKKLIKRFSDAYNALGEAERQNIDNYGFPFVGEIWMPHLTIASFDKRAFDIIWKNFKDECPQGNYKISRMNIHQLDEKTEKMNVIKSYKI